jgi:hypothetical protein
MAIPFRAPRGNGTRSRLGETLEEILSKDGKAVMQRGYAIVPLDADGYESVDLSRSTLALYTLCFEPPGIELT